MKNINSPEKGYAQFCQLACKHVIWVLKQSCRVFDQSNTPNFKKSA